MAQVDSAKPGFEAELKRLLGEVWKARVLMAILFLVATAIGVAVAFLTEPVYQAAAQVMPKEGQKQSGIGGALAGLGGMSGMLVSQFGMGNASLDRLEVIVKSWELADSVLIKNNLLPDLFPEKWDSAKGDWKSKAPGFVPQVRDGIDKIRGSTILVGTDPLKNLMTITANARTAELAVRMVTLYLRELNEKIRSDVIAESKSNQEFLEAQKRATFDPLLLNKIQNMLGFEIERQMLATDKSVDVLEGPLIPTMRMKPQRKRIIAISMLLGLAAGCLTIYFRSRPA